MRNPIEADGVRSFELKKVTYTRLNNPLSSPLKQSSLSYSRFHQVVNDAVSNEGGIEIKRPKLETATGPNYGSTYNVIEIPFNDLGEGQKRSIEAITSSVFAYPHVEVKSSFQLPISESKGSSLLLHRLTKPMLTYYLSNPDEKLTSNPYLENGVFLQDKRHLPLIGVYAVQAKRLRLIDHLPQHGTLRIQDRLFHSEAEIAYLSVVSSLVLAGRLDLSTDEKMKESIPYRRSLFLRIYKELLSDMMPAVTRDEVIGLENQIMDINTNLLKPLVDGTGNPMNSLLVGAPGVGKSFLTRHLAYESDLLVFPVGVGIFSNESERQNFESRMLSTLSRIRQELQLPVVIWIDDVEAILEAGLSENADGSISRSIDVEKRSRALTFLERLMDTHKIYLIGTLNHPDVEAAFLRRFNPIYFPLPNLEQRKQHLLKVLHGKCDDEGIIRELATRTEGFNYSGIESISGYMQNANGAFADVREVLQHAVSKARQRSNTVALRQFDEAARLMIGETKPRLGFKT